MYEYVEESVIKPYRRYCSNIMIELRDSLNENYDITTQFSLVGSGSDSRNMVTANGNGPFDLDYNLQIIRMPDKYWNNLMKLKDTVRNELNKIVHNTFFSDGKDSKSVITSLLHFNDEPNVEFSFDIAILARNNNGNWCRLIHNKSFQNQFTWNEVPTSHNVKDKAQALKSKHLWNEVRDRYLDLKNKYLRNNDNNHPSFIVYVEAVNQIYQRYFR